MYIHKDKIGANYISKDKIREKIKELREEPCYAECIENNFEKAELLEKLLEEN